MAIHSIRFFLMSYFPLKDGFERQRINRNIVPEMRNNYNTYEERLLNQTFSSLELNVASLKANKHKIAGIWVNKVVSSGDAFIKFPRNQWQRVRPNGAPPSASILY